MKLKYALLLMMFLAVQISAQLNPSDYPLVSIRDIQYQHPDSLRINGDQPSQYEGDTLRVQGIVMTAPYKGASPDSTVLMYLGSGACGLYLQDKTDKEFGGILLRQNPAADPFNILDTGYVIEALGYVGEYASATQSTTQFNVIQFDQTNVIGVEQRPAPTEITLDSLSIKGTGDPYYMGEQWEGVYIEVKNVTTFDRQSTGSFKVIDENGTIVNVGTKSNYYYRNQAPLDGTKLSVIRGYIETRLDAGTTINPAYKEDVVVGKFPPFVTNISRDMGLVLSGDEVTVSATIKDNDGTVASAFLFYTLDMGTTLDSIQMTTNDDSTYFAVLPGQPDSTLVAYYVKATDNEDNSSTNPGNPETGAYFYRVLDRPLFVQDVQYSPFGSGYSGYNGFDVMLSGVVTADTSDITGDGGSIGAKVYLQNGNGPWSGIWLFGTEALKLQKGDSVTVKGTVRESFAVTRIEGLDLPENVIVHGKTNVPEATLISTSDVDRKSSGDVTAESYESVLIKYSGVKVVDENADGEVGPTRNYGEMYIADSSGVQTRVELQDGNHGYHNFWDASLENVATKISTGDEFSAISGILFFSYGNYKLVPRKDDDFEGFVPTAISDDISRVSKFELSQNYPNPFNPSTIIEYSIPKESVVKLDVYNVIGQKVASLVNSVQSSGLHSVHFNASKLSSGIYIYRLTADNLQTVKKMMLIK